MVPEPTGQVAQVGEDVGPQQHHGRVRAVRGHGPPLAAAAGEHRQVGRGGHRRFERPLAARWVITQRRLPVNVEICSGYISSLSCFISGPVVL